MAINGRTPVLSAPVHTLLLAALAVVLGALPMLAHGYMILFRGTRLF